MGDYFPNPGLYGEFAGGMIKFLNSLRVFLDTIADNSENMNTSVKLFFSAKKPHNLMVVTSDNAWLENQLKLYNDIRPIRYSPAIRFGRILYSYHELQVLKSDAGFSVEHISYGESFFCYVDEENIFFIEPLSDIKSLKGEMSFVYDQKWSELEFLTSADVLKLYEKIERDKLELIFKKFCIESMIKPFSSFYTISVDKL